MYPDQSAILGRAHGWATTTDSFPLTDHEPSRSEFNVPPSLAPDFAPPMPPEPMHYSVASGEESPTGFIARVSRVYANKPGKPSVRSELHMPDRQYAEKLLHEARVALAQGRYEAARASALKAREFDVNYELFDERPAHILAAIERKTGKTSVPATTSTKVAQKPARSAEIRTRRAEPSGGTATKQLVTERRNGGWLFANP